MPRWTSAENKAQRMDTDTEVAEQLVEENRCVVLAAGTKLQWPAESEPWMDTRWDEERAEQDYKR